MSRQNHSQRMAVLACLQGEPNFDAFLNSFSLENGPLLRWLDESGLCLYLTHRLDQRGLLNQLPPSFRRELERRVEANRHRTSLMLAEFQRVNDALQARSVTYAFVKGFTLAPEFCPDPALRHQSDLDLLIDPQSLPVATAALLAIGYEISSRKSSGEVQLVIPTDHVPSANDFLYDPPHHRHIELHPAFFQATCGVSLSVGQDWISHIEQCRVDQALYPVLSFPYRFIGQVLHAFHHIPSWIRLSWLYEISFCIARSRHDCDLWANLDQITLHNPRARNACAVIFRMLELAFGTEIPPLQKKWIEDLPSPHSAWLRCHAESLLLGDFNFGDKFGLILFREFADSSLDWWSFRLGNSVRFVVNAFGSRRSGPKFLAERLRKQIRYSSEVILWKLRRSLISRRDSGSTVR